MTRATVPLNIKNARHRIARAQGAPYLAECLGDDGKTYDKANPGYLWVREILSVNPTTGGMITGQAYQVRATGQFIPYYGARVVVKYDEFDGEWDISRMDFTSFVAQGGNPAVLNTLNPYTRETTLDSISILRTYAVSDGNTATTEVSIKNFLGIDPLGDLIAFRLSDDDRPDISDYAPTTDGYKRLVHLWLDYDNTIRVSQSTPISVMQDFDVFIDLAEVMEDRPNQLARPIGVWIATYGMTATTPNDFYCDTRQWLENPSYDGFPNPVDKNYVVPEGITETVHGDLTVTADLTVLGDLTVMPTTTRITSEGGTFGDQNAGNYTIFEDDGTMRMEGDATVWEDLQFPIETGKVPTSGYPDWEPFTAKTSAYGFAVDEKIDCQANELPHSWKLGTTVHPHLHITTKAANSTGGDRFAKFTIDIAYAKTGGTWTETPRTAELTIPNGTAALQLFYLDMGDLALTGYTIGTEIKPRVKRIAATGGTEYSGNIFITQLGMHYERDALGSRTETTK